MQINQFLNFTNPAALTLLRSDIARSRIIPITASFIHNYGAGDVKYVCSNPAPITATLNPADQGGEVYIHRTSGNPVNLTLVGLTLANGSQNFATVPPGGIKITYLTSTQVFIEQRMPRKVLVRATLASGTFPGSAAPGTAINGWTELSDLSNSFDNVAGAFNPPRDGHYRFSGQLLFSSVSGSAGSRCAIIPSINGSSYSQDAPIISLHVPYNNPGNIALALNFVQYLQAGSQVILRVFNDASTGCSVAGNSNFNFLSIEEII